MAATAQTTGQRSPQQAERRTRLLTAFALLGILAVGLALRWYGLGYAEFNGDQASDLDRAYQIVYQSNIAFHAGMSSSGAYQGPVEYYWLAIPLLLTTDPAIATGFVGLLQMLAVAGTYWFAARYFGGTAGLIACFLYAVNPWAVHLGRKIWPDDLMPLPALLFIAAIYGAVAGRRPWMLAATCALLTFLVLTHPAGVVWAALLLLVVVLFWRRLGWRPLVVGALVSLALVAPYVYDDAQHGFISLSHYLEASPGPEANVDLDSLRIVAGMGTGDGIGSRVPAGWEGGPLALAVEGLDRLASALMALGLAIASWRLVAARPWRGKKVREGWEKYLLLLLWCAVPVLATLRHSMPWVQPYFTSVYPAQFVLIGLALASGAQWLRRQGTGLGRAGTAVGAVALALALSQVLPTWQSLASPEPLADRYPFGLPLRYQQQAMANLRGFLPQAEQAPVYFYCSYNQWEGLHYLARPDVALQKVTPPQALLLPRDPSRGVVLVVAINDTAAPPLGFAAVEDSSPIISEALALGFQDLPDLAVRGTAGQVFYRFLYLPPANGQSVLDAYRAPGQELVLTNGLRLAGYKLPAAAKAGEPLRMSLLWEIPGETQDLPWGDYVLFAHLLDREGRALAQQDWGIFQYRLFWRNGEYMVSTYDLPLGADLGPGLAYLSLGAYEFYGREQVGWLDGGKPAEKSYQVGPLKLLPAQAPPAPRTSVGATFGDWLQLEGYDLAASAVKAGEGLDVVLTWRALMAPPGDYTMSLQLLDGAGRLVAQQDSPPVDGDYPTSAWAAGERVRDARRLALPPGLAPGSYRLVAVVYASQGGQRLAVAGADSLGLLAITVR